MTKALEIFMTQIKLLLRRSRTTKPPDGDTGLAGHWGEDQLRGHHAGGRPGGEGGGKHAL